MDEERIRSIQTLGYTEREAQFLCLVALHGAHFVRRQFVEFAGCKLGDTPQRFLSKLLRNEHATFDVFRHSRQVFRLRFQPFFSLLGEDVNRNHRRKQHPAIKRRIMGLDYVLAHRTQRFLGSQQDKVEFFHGTLGIPVDDLPSQTYKSRDGRLVSRRFFVDGFPIQVASPASASTPAAVSFSYIDEGYSTLSAFTTHLSHYLPLFRALREIEIVYIGGSSVLFTRAERTFHRVLTGRDPEQLISADPRQLFRFFRDRHLFESYQTADFDKERLDQLRDDWDRFGSETFDELYALWRQAGEPAVMARLAELQGESHPIRGQFRTFLLKHDYDLFGTLHAAC